MEFPLVNHPDDAAQSFSTLSADDRALVLLILQEQRINPQHFRQLVPQFERGFARIDEIYGDQSPQEKLRRLGVALQWYRAREDVEAFRERMTAIDAEYSAPKTGQS
ncbi:MAG: hypothetical protein PHO20_03005 [Candidatus Peribacteraceae bacterium]|nr:hypothetical protein [Candidatus Peribacteraceae bacterium]MDD5739710.1 hypothetical protein [Candidatus Peribacteraceae bacterium]